MQNKILEFTNILRKSGVRVSTAESIDAFRALDLVSIEEREVFRDALRTTMVKRGEDVPTFNELFDLYWSGFYDTLRDAFDAAAERLGDFDMDLEELLQQIAEMMKNMDGDVGDLSELAKAMLEENYSLSPEDDGARKVRPALPPVWLANPTHSLRRP